jgi:hypothetical protein
MILKKSLKFMLAKAITMISEKKREIFNSLE